MFLAVDIGNSNIKFGVFEGSTLISKQRISTPRDLSIADPAAFSALELPFPVTDVMICSVVPVANNFVAESLGNRFGVPPRFVTNDADFGLDIRYDPLGSAGTDRIVGAFAAAEIFGVPCVVCSFGTALTVDAVDTDRRLLGGVIAPGPHAMARALSASTAQLPEVDLSVLPDRLIQTATAPAITSGILNGYLGMADRLIRSVKAECDADARVIATGGYAGFAGEHLDVVEVVEPDLILEGLRLCYHRWAQ